MLALDDDNSWSLGGVAGSGGHALPSGFPSKRSASMAITLLCTPENERVVPRLQPIDANMKC